MKKMGRRFKAVTFMLVVAIFMAVFSSPAQQVKAASVASSGQQLSEIQKKIEDYNNKLASMNSEMTGLLEKKEQIDSKIEIISDKMASTNALISAYDEQIGIIKDRIEVLNADIDSKYDMFKSWLRTNQLYGDIRPIEMVFSASSFVEFLENIDRVGTLIEYQNDVLDTLRIDSVSLAEQSNRLEQMKSEQLSVKEGLQVDSESLTALRTESEGYITNLQSNIDTAEKLRDEVKTQEDELNASIEAELKRVAEEQEREAARQESIRVAEEIAAEESRKAAENAQTEKAESGTSAPETERVTPDTESVVVPSGDTPSFLWPIAERRLVSTTYLYERPGDAPHRGIDIPAPAGTAILAAESGTVITAAKHSSYGNYVIISHGGGYATLYAHCTKLFVSVGQKVSRGETIASVGSTGYSSGNHLHYEVRKNGALTDPLSYYDYMKSEIVIQIYG